MLIGVLGAGQLGQMLGQAAVNLGARMRFYDPAPNGPASAVGEQHTGEWSDFTALEHFCKGLDACTFEFENVPAATLEFVAARIPTHPSVHALTTGQDRANEKQVFSQIGFEVPPYALVDSESGLHQAALKVGLPAILKSRRFGYDGKGQAVVRSAEDLTPAWNAIGQRSAILEAFVPFTRELSIIAARSASGEIVTYPLTENVHTGGILTRSLAPATVSRATAEIAAQRVRALLEALNYRGTLAIEMFEVLTTNGPVLIPNEFAPRVHNTGHWTIEGAVTSQFENHIRAVLGLPLGDPSPRGHAGMLNLIGTHPTLQALAQVSGAALHLYGKEPRPGRKLGHATAVDSTRAGVLARLESLSKLSQS